MLAEIAAWSPRRWVAAVVGATVTALVIGLPTDVIPNPVFGRPVPVTAWSYPVPGRYGEKASSEAWPAGPWPQSCARAIASVSGTHRFAARTIPTATCATSTAWVRRVLR